jgi:hypothetical protein
VIDDRLKRLREVRAILRHPALSFLLGALLSIVELAPEFLALKEAAENCLALEAHWPEGPPRGRKPH